MILFKCALLSVMVVISLSPQAQPIPPGMVDSAKVPRPFFHYQQEYTFDQPANPSQWKQVSPGLHLSFASTDRAYFRAEVPIVGAEQLTWKGSAWRGERVNIMLLAWSPDTLSQLRLILGDLKTTAGKTISKSNCTMEMVRYVVSNYPYDAREVTCGEGPVDKAFLMPDRLEAFDRFDLPGNTTRPVWITIDIPPGTTAGSYKGNIEVRTDKTVKTVALELLVQNQTLPPPAQWSFRLDLWQNPWVIAEYYKVKPWSDAHKALLKKHMQLYAAAGGKYITTYAVHSPWSDNSYMIEGTMIEWIKQKNGSWKFDYSIFDQYVQLAIDAGIDKAITLYTPIPWGERFRFINATTGNYETEQWLPTSAIFTINWNAFLTDFKKHLEQKGWFDKLYLGINENAMEQTLAAIRAMKNHSPKWKITYAGDWHPELDGLLDDYSCVFGKEPRIEDVKARNAKKQTTSFYVCCTPAKPNTFVFSPPVEGRWLGWYTAGYGYNGFLRWAYDAWPADPARDARHVLWPAGDCFMVYPGAQRSIRFEKMREGIVDFEKLNIIKSKASRSTDKTVQAKWKEVEELLKAVSAERDPMKEKLEQQVVRGQQLLNELSDRLAGQ